MTSTNKRFSSSDIQNQSYVYFSQVKSAKTNINAYS